MDNSPGIVTVASNTSIPIVGQAGFGLAYLNGHSQEPSPYASSTVSEGTLLSDQTKDPINPTGSIMVEENKASSAQWPKAGAGSQNPLVGAKSTLNEGQMANNDRSLKTDPVDPNAAVSRPKRVRTGCLTCRERHLKCDEGVPDCVNCRKSHRACRRGVRLNFIDTQVKTLPITSLTQDWEVTFQDESREIASEYKGGLNRYGKIEQGLEEGEDVKVPTQFEIPVGIIDTPVLEHQQLPSHHHTVPPGGVETYAGGPQRASDRGESLHQHHASTSESTFSNHTIPTTHSQNSYTPPAQSLAPRSNHRAVLTSPEEALYMQAFVEEVGLWMDSMDPYKHVGLDSSGSGFLNAC